MRPRRLAPLALALACPLAAAQDAAPTFEEAARAYEASLTRPALLLRAEALERLASTGDPRALRALLERYARPDAPPLEVQYLIAGAAGAAFDATPGAAEALLGLCRKARGPEHAWLWFNALRLQARTAPDAVVAVAGDRRADPWVRAAAVHGVAAVATDAVVPAVRAALGGAARPRGAALALVAEACAEALGQARPAPAREDAAAALGLVVDALDDKALGPRSRLVVARALGRALDAPELWLDAASWRKLLAARAAAPEGEAAPAGGTRTRRLREAGVSTPRFLGVPCAGVRVVFVLDLSDSMLTPLAADDLAALRRPRTGDDGEDDGVAALPWDRITDRFDAAREGLLQALAALGEKNRFAVVVFGEKAEALLEPRLLPATPKNVARAVAAVRALRAGPPAERRPRGTLRGETNLDGGLRLAFRLTDEAPLADREHVAAEGFATGADTVFLLSDGAPSWDDFPCEDVRQGDYHAGDPETSEDLEDSERLTYYGPYVLPDLLVRDVARMNLLRAVELHAVGFGEADPTLLERLAALGHGHVRWLGAPRSR